jgi:hypothetical protein
MGVRGMDMEIEPTAKYRSDLANNPLGFPTLSVPKQVRPGWLFLGELAGKRSSAMFRE